MSPAQQWARTVASLSTLAARHPDAGIFVLVERQAELVNLWAQEQKMRLDAWAARGALGRSPLESFDDWRDRRSL